MTEMKGDELKKQFRGMARAAQVLGIAYIGVVNGLFAALQRLGKADAAALAAASGMDSG